jgi:hypothetical protein
LEECCKEQGQLAEASKEGLGSEWAVVPMMMMMMMMMSTSPFVMNDTGPFCMTLHTANIILFYVVKK